MAKAKKVPSPKVTGFFSSLARPAPARKGPKPNVVFAFVRHPGTKAQPYLGPALKLGLKVLRLNIEKTLATFGAGKKKLTEAALIKALDVAVRTAALFAKQSAARNAPVNTGRLKGSINVQKRGTLFYTVGTNVKYARWVEDGTRPHIIRPKNKQALAFYWKKWAGLKKGIDKAHAKISKGK